jgi:SAM-dependent methyltransferase
VGGISRRFAAGASKLPAPRDESARRMLIAARDLVQGREPKSPAFGSDYSGDLPKPAPFHDLARWVQPPVIERPNDVVQNRFETGSTAERFDVDLVDALNDEYASKRIVTRAPSFVVEDRMDVARKRMAWLQQRVDLRGKTTLEIGCHTGYEAWMLAHNAGCDAYGIDVQQRKTWDVLRGDRVHYECADMALENPFPKNKFDVIYSFQVWEHVVHPHALLQAAYDSLKPGGIAWIRANLFHGVKASHRYRDLYFPWPHLLFSEDVLRDWDVRHGRAPAGPTWVNRLNWDNYERSIRDIGFRFRSLSFTKSPWDEPFYRRFEDMLGRYPRRDLERDYFLAILQKPA